MFGRGAEEAEELQRAGIPFKIVPGISAALGAAAYSGIPLTDRRHASRVTFATGRVAREQRQAHQRETPVLYMAATRLAENLEKLTRAGWSPDTPAAYVASATKAKQLVADLAATAASVESIAIYSHIEIFPDLAPLPEVLVLPSSSAARSILDGPYAKSLRGLPAVAIGARTRKAAERLGTNRIFQTPRDNVESVIDIVLGLFADVTLSALHLSSEAIESAAGL